MKPFITILIITTVIFFACQSQTSSNLWEEIPGVYVKEIQHEYAKGMDTLVITELDRESGTYTILRSSTYHQMIDGKSFLPKTEQHQWIADFDKRTNQLKVQNKERVFSFLPNERKLLMGTSEFIKISD